MKSEVKVTKVVRPLHAHDKRNQLLTAKKWFDSAERCILKFWNALYEIRESGAYKEEHASFEAYCREVFSYDASTVSRRLRVIVEVTSIIKAHKLQDTPFSWEASYEIIAAKDKLPGPRYDELIVSVLKGEITRAVVTKEIHEAVCLDDKRAGELIDEEILVHEAEAKALDLHENDFEFVSDTSAAEMHIAGIESHATYIIDNLPDVIEQSRLDVKSERLNKLQRTLGHLKNVVDKFMEEPLVITAKSKQVMTKSKARTQ